MVFNSGVFLYFLAVVLAVYFGLYRLKRGRLYQNRFLLVASYFFYGWWDWIFLALIFLSTIIDYFVALGLERSSSPKRRRLLVLISLLANLGMLAAFKYYDFFAESLLALLRGIAPEYAPSSDSWLFLRVVLPVGISFYTFQTLSYTLDVYRRQIPAERNFLDFALFVSFFPQLVAGPIERAGDLLPQFKRERRLLYSDLEAGAYMILLGFFMKTYVADNLAPYVDAVYLTSRQAWQANPDYVGMLGAPRIFFASIAFAFQIYGDFAGYSMIALGSARLLGIRLTLNFNVPFFSQNPAELWRRWHVTLNRWLTDYVYISMGGSHYGAIRKFRNLFIVFLLTGLWHGANWTFVAWGAYFGVWMILYMLLAPGLPKLPTAPLWRRRQGQALRVLLCFVTFAMSAVLFRAHDIRQSLAMYGSLLRFPRDLALYLAGSLSGEQVFGSPLLGASGYKIASAILKHSWILLLLDFYWRKTDNPLWIFDRPFWLRIGVYLLLYFMILTMGVFGKDVIYFAF